VRWGFWGASPSLSFWDLIFELISSRLLHAEQKDMNRQKKLQQLFKAKAKKASAKLAPQSKTKYVSKADRLKLAAESSDDSVVSAES
jgi:hypothetical protein